MALSKNVKHRLQVDEWGVISVQRITQFLEDGSIEAEKTSRYTLEPGDDTSAAPSIVQDIAARIWTQARIDAYAVHKAAIEAGLPE